MSRDARRAPDARAAGPRRVSGAPVAPALTRDEQRARATRPDLWPAFRDQPSPVDDDPDTDE